MHAAPPEQLPRLLVADSFRVRGSAGSAEVRGYDLHLKRFLRSVEEVVSSREYQLSDSTSPSLPTQEVAAFLRDATTRINYFGEGFPRFELWDHGAQDPGDLELKLSLRSLPVLRDTIHLQSVRLDSLVRPHLKGPNIGFFSGLNCELQAEALRVDADGYIVEGATTAIVWWSEHRGFIAPREKRVASVAEALVQRIATGHGAPLEEQRIAPEDLLTKEVWAVNALHGLRRVSSIDGVAVHQTASSPSWASLPLMQKHFDETWEPVASKYAAIENR